MRLQSITSFCAPKPDHSDVAQRDALMRAELDGVEHVGSEIAVA